MSEEIQLDRLIIKLGANNGAVFWAALLPDVVDFGDGITSLVNLRKYHSRADENALFLPAGNAMQMPRAFHASLQASGLLLHHYYATGMKYEDAPSQMVKPRTILQSYARMYSVDVNDVAKFYPQARQWLSHTNLDHPTTLEGVISAIKISQKKRIN